MKLTKIIKNQKILWAVGSLALLFFFTLTGLFFYAETKLSKLVVGGLGESFSTKIYSFPYFIRNHSNHSYELLLNRLERLKYQNTQNTILEPGQYKKESSGLTIYLRGFESPTYVQNPILVSLRSDRKLNWALEDENHQEIYEIALEPELVAELSGRNKIRRSPARWDEFPPHLIHAVTTAEDHKFFQHWGIRPIAIVRALLHNITTEGSLHGGSTITQQLAKNLFLTPRRTIRRKIVEAFLAIYLELRYTKEKILTIYLNHIYMGQDGFISVAGMKSAARYYFNTDLKDLDLNQSALLAGMIRSPYKYNPFQNPDQAKSRRDYILKRMSEGNLISAQDLFKAENVLLPTRSIPHDSQKGNANDYFVSEIVRQLTPYYGDEALYRYGLKIYSTMDPLYQSFASQSSQKTEHQVGLIAIDPDSGFIKALIGGKDYKKSQYNRATQALRQPGSAFKPFVYGAALEKGLTPTTFLEDKIKTYKGKENEDWTPENFDNVYLGTVTLRNALANSINAATLNLAQTISPQTIIEFANRMGITSPLENTLAIGLGAYEVTLLEITSAYTPFANGGFRIKPTLVLSVVDAEGSVIELDPPVKKSVLDPVISFLITSLLKSVVEYGTARSLKKFEWTQPTAGKTGTSNLGKDAWFIGYTPTLLAGVWIGNDQSKPINAYGSKNALPIWVSFMKKCTAELQIEDFSEPTGLIKVKIDPITGMLVQTGCPNRIIETFLEGTQPTEKCPLHPGGIKGWFKKIFGS